MQTPDGTWRVEVGGIGSVAWYRLVGPGVSRTVPSVGKLADVLGEVGVDLGDFVDADPAPERAERATETAERATETAERATETAGRAREHAGRAPQRGKRTREAA